MDVELVRTRMLFRSGLHTVAAVLVACASVAQGQRQVQAQTQAPVALASSVKSSTRVSVDADNLPLKVVVEDIVRQASLSLMYGQDVFDREARVSLHLKNVVAHEALSAAVRGTGIAVTVLPSGRVVLTRTDVSEGRQQATGTIAGRVVMEKTGQPLRNATLLLDDAAKGIVTNDDGHFTVRASAGTHRISVRAVGYTKQVRSVTVADGQTSTLEFVLAPSVSALDEVIVTGTVVATERKAIPTPITVITAEDIEKRGITRIEELMRGEIPGVFAIETGVSRYDGIPTTLGAMVTTTVYSRGASSVSGGATPLKTYIDGVELLDPSYLGTIDPRSIERIEVITGPQAATVYGSGAMGGVMQIFTKKGSGRNSTDIILSLRYGILENSFNTGLTPSHNHSMSLSGGIGPALSYSGTLSYGYQGQWQPGLFNQNGGASIGVAHVRGPVSVSSSISTTLGRNGTAYGIQGGTIYSNSTRALEGEYAWNSNFPSANSLTRRTGSSNAMTVSTEFAYRAAPWWQHHVTVGRNYSEFAMTPSRPAFIDATDTLYKGSASTGKRTTFSYNTTVSSAVLHALTSTLTLGTSGSFGSQTSVDGCLTTETASSWTPCTPTAPVNVTRPLNSRSWGGFGTWRLGIFDQLFVTAALRGERNPAYGAAHKIDWTPTHGAAYTVEVGKLTMKLQGSYGRATRPPTPDQKLEMLTFSADWDPALYASRIANPALTPEYSRGPQGGIEFYYGNVGSLTINHYQQVVSDLIDLAIFDSVLRVSRTSGDSLAWYRYQYQNSSTVRQMGWDATGTLNFGPLSVKGTYSWVDSRVRSVHPRYTGAAPNVGGTFSYLPTHTGSVVVGYAKGGASITLTTNYIGSAIRQAWYTNNLFVNQQVYARIKNYVDTKNTGLGGYSTTAAAYIKSNLAASQRVNSWISATLNMTNVGNSHNTDRSELEPSLGRQTLFGLSMRFPR